MKVRGNEKMGCGKMQKRHLSFLIVAKLIQIRNITILLMHKSPSFEVKSLPRHQITNPNPFKPHLTQILGMLQFRLNRHIINFRIQYLIQIPTNTRGSVRIVWIGPLGE